MYITSRNDQTFTILPLVVYTHCAAYHAEHAVLDSIISDTSLLQFDNGMSEIFQFCFHSPTG